jgi:DNA mismatch endonuclease (patch repair protein)
MRANKGRDTSPELAVRRAVHKLGLRYRVSARPDPTLRRTADLVFSRKRVAVFVDGCFWHGCPQHHTVAKRNADFWAHKVAQNIARDRQTSPAVVVGA